MVKSKPSDTGAYANMLASKVQAGDETRFCDLMEMIQPIIFANCNRWRVSADDLESRAAEKILRGLRERKYREGSPFLLWAKRVVSNVAIDITRLKRLEHAEMEDQPTLMVIESDIRDCMLDALMGTVENGRKVEGDFWHTLAIYVGYSPRQCKAEFQAMMSEGQFHHFKTKHERPKKRG